MTSNNTREALRAEMLAAGYIPGEQFLSADCHLRQYEAAPDRVGVLFANGLRYHGAQLLVGGKVQPPGFAPQLHEGETFSLRIWWTVDAPPTQPFQIGLYIRDAQGVELLAEHRHPQQIASGVVYREELRLQLPYPLWRQDIELTMALVIARDGSIIAAPGNTDERGHLRLFTIRVDSW